MVEINSHASALQAQLQAQLQANSRRAVKTGTESQRPADVVSNRINEREAESRRSEADRKAPVQKSSRGNELSSSRELVAAEERVVALNANNREAPVGRISTQANSGRNVPLGQIIDIRV